MGSAVDRPDTDPGAAEDRSTDALYRLRRWEDAGAVWRVASRTQSEVVISFLTCSAGEEVDRMTSTDPAVLAFVAAHGDVD
jgi:hypothetical protein